jgi:hypothetical protein
MPEAVVQRAQETRPFLKGRGSIWKVLKRDFENTGACGWKTSRKFSPTGAAT